MFHRAKIEPRQTEMQGLDSPQPESEPTVHKMVMTEQTAIHRYTKPEPASVPAANQNATRVAPVTSFQQQKEDIVTMNTSDTQAKDQNAETQSNPSQPAPGRMDIPGSQFSRPGQPPMPGRMPGAYPGAYPGSTPSSYNPHQTANDAASQRKLVVGQGITLSGEIESCDHLIVEGTIEAALKGASMLDIAESGSYFGTVEIEEATVAGRFEGDLTVKGRLTVRSTGSITGSIAYKELAVEAGATIDGKMTPLDAKAQAGGRKIGKKAGGEGELPFGSKTAAAE